MVSWSPYTRRHRRFSRFAIDTVAMFTISAASAAAPPRTHHSSADQKHLLFSCPTPVTFSRYRHPATAGDLEAPTFRRVRSSTREQCHDNAAAAYVDAACSPPPIPPRSRIGCADGGGTLQLLLSSSVPSRPSRTIRAMDGE